MATIKVIVQIIDENGRCIDDVEREGMIVNGEPEAGFFSDVHDAVLGLVAWVGAGLGPDPDDA